MNKKKLKEKNNEKSKIDNIYIDSIFLFLSVFFFAIF